MFILRDKSRRKGAESRNKYGAKKVITAEGTFDSKYEYECFLEYKDDERRGVIKCFSHHHRFALCVDEIKLGEYEADFYFFDNRSQSWVVVDCKGVETALFKWKWKHMKAQYRTFVYILRTRASDKRNSICDIYDKRHDDERQSQSAEHENKP